MKTIRLTAVLDYYDGVQVFEDRDAEGGFYVGTMIGSEGDFDRYVVTAALPEGITEFRKGTQDLRMHMLEAPSSEWYLTVAKGDLDFSLDLEPQNKPLPETEFLPDAGYKLSGETLEPHPGTPS